jgi:hypothetical protein
LSAVHGAPHATPLTISTDTPRRRANVSGLQVAAERLVRHMDFPAIITPELPAAGTVAREELIRRMDDPGVPGRRSDRRAT